VQTIGRVLGASGPGQDYRIAAGQGLAQVAETVRNFQRCLFPRAGLLADLVNRMEVAALFLSGCGLVQKLSQYGLVGGEIAEPRCERFLLGLQLRGFQGGAPFLQLLSLTRILSYAFYEYRFLLFQETTSSPSNAPETVIAP
jgi:hypothetical protein